MSIGAKRLALLVPFACEAVWRVSLGLAALTIMYKIQVANDITHTLAEDPMELWIAIGVSMLLIDQASKWIRPTRSTPGSGQ